MSAGDGSLVGLSPQPVDSDTVAEWTVSGLSSVVERPAGIAENRLVGGGGGESPHIQGPGVSEVECFEQK